MPARKEHEEKVFPLLKMTGYAGMNAFLSLLLKGLLAVFTSTLLVFLLAVRCFFKFYFPLNLFP